MHLSEKDLHQIEGYISLGMKDAHIAKKVGRNKSVISRLFAEFPRDGFSSEEVQRIRFERHSERSSAHIRIPPWWELEGWLMDRIQLWDSPEQACGRWKLEKWWWWWWWWWHLSKDTLYEAVYKRFPKFVKTHFRRKGKKYRDRKKDKALGKYQIRNRKMIDSRPKEIEAREVAGHWEGDTVIGRNHEWAILTMVERKTGYAFAWLLPWGKDALGLASALNRFLKTLPDHLKKTVTFDNGREFAQHAIMEIEAYFAHPYHSWERGTNENWNGLLREFFPKRTDFSTISQNDVTKAFEKLNSRPRKRLGYLTPEEAFQKEWESCISV